MLAGGRASNMTGLVSVKAAGRETKRVGRLNAKGKSPKARGGRRGPVQLIRCDYSGARVQISDVDRVDVCQASEPKLEEGGLS